MGRSRAEVECGLGLYAESFSPNSNTLTTPAPGTFMMPQAVCKVRKQRLVQVEVAKAMRLRR